MIATSLKDSIVTAVDSNEDLLLQISKFIHSHPESNYQEFECSKYLSEQLSALGFKVEYPFCGVQTAFRAMLPTMVGNKGPHVAILAEFDALSVTMPDGSSSIVHACGHNLNCSAAVGAGIALKKVSQELRGTVSIIGTPAEEGGGGKVALLDAGAFDGVDAILTVHGDQRDWYTVARACSAGEFLHVTFLGHPASDGYSRNYVSATDAAVLFLTVLGFLDSRLTPDSLIQRKLLPAAHAVNTIPLECSVDVQIRSGDESYLERVKAQVVQAAEGVARALGAQARVEPKGYRYERIIENKTLEEAAKGCIESLGHKFTYDEPSPYPFGTDTGNLSHHIPTVQFLIGRPEGFKFHTPEAVEQSISDSAQDMMIESAKILAVTTAEILLNPDVSARAKEELDRYRRTAFADIYSWHRKM